MRIAYISDQLLPQRATDTEQILSMVSALGTVGAHVELIVPARWLGRAVTPADLGDYYQVEPAFDMTRIHSIYPSIRGLEKIAHGVVSCLSEPARQADVIYSRNLPVVDAALRLTDRPVVYETYRPWPRQRLYLGPYFRHIGRHPRFLGAVLHSGLAANSYRDCGVPAERLLVAHNGYDPRRMEPKLSKAEARRRCGLPMEGAIVSYAGNVSAAKGHMLVLDMAEHLPGVHFALVGSAGPKGSVERRAQHLANVSVHPWQPFDKVIPFLYAADVLLIPPTRGPMEKVGNTVLPIKTFLYLAAGRPIFGPDTEDLREVLADGENAVLVRPDDCNLAVDRLRAMLDDPDEIQRLGQVARNSSEGLTWHARARLVLDFLETRCGQLAQG